MQPKSTTAPSRQPRKITNATIERAALWRLKRRPLTVEQLRRSLNEKVRHATAAHGACPEAGTFIDDIIERCLRTGRLDDHRLAASRASALRDRGMSKRMILERLRQKGVAQAVARNALAETDVGAVDAELRAARQYVQLRRLRSKDREEALASLARNGFSFDTAKRALAAD